MQEIKVEWNDVFSNHGGSDLRGRGWPGSILQDFHTGFQVCSYFAAKSFSS